MSFIRDFIFGKAPDPNPGMVANAAASEKVGLAQVQLGTDQLAYQKERAKITDALADRLTTSTAGLMDTQNKISKDEYDRYQKTYVPLEDSLAKDAASFDTESQREKYALSASADVKKAFANSADQSLRSQARLGLRPSADAFAAINSRLAANEAGATAAGQTAARYNARDTGIQMRTNAVNIGKGIPGTASNAATGSVNAANSATNTQGMANNSYNAGANSANSFTNTGLGFMNSAAQGFNNVSNYGLNVYGMQGQQTASILNAAGTAYAFRNYADGEYIEGPGHVTGPGTGISDSIPARLSDGEYVIPADVVKRKGVEFFDKLLDKHHMPAAEQKRKYGIGGR